MRRGEKNERRRKRRRKKRERRKRRKRRKRRRRRRRRRRREDRGEGGIGREEGPRRGREGAEGRRSDRQPRRTLLPRPRPRLAWPARIPESRGGSPPEPRSDRMSEITFGVVVFQGRSPSHLSYASKVISRGRTRVKLNRVFFPR